MNPRTSFPDAHKLLELRGLVAGLCDAELTSAQVARLEEMICTDTACALYYVNAMSVYATLPQHVGVAPSMSAAKLVTQWQTRDNDFWNDVVTAAAALEEPAQRPVAHVESLHLRENFRGDTNRPHLGGRGLRRISDFLGVKPQVAWVTALCLTCVAFAGALGWLISRTTSEQPLTVANVAEPDHGPIARLTNARQIKWEGDQQSLPVSTQLAKGQRLRLAAGVAEITFESGAVTLVEGPAEFEIRSDNEGYLRRGRTLANVPAAARGFAIETKDIRIVDLGTEFGVEVDSQQNTRVGVIRGVVDAYVAADAQVRKPIRIDANRSIQYDAESRTVHQAPLDPSRFEQIRSTLERPVITEIRVSSGKAYQVAHHGLKEDALAYIDRRYEWNGLSAGIPNELVGADYVLTSNNDDLDPNFELRITVDEPATLYVLFDKRAKAPEWLTRDFVETGLGIGLDTGEREEEFAQGPGRSIDVRFSVWKRSINAGTTVCGPTNQPNVAHYGVAVIAGQH